MSMSKRTDGRWIVKYKDVASGQWRQRSFTDEREAREFDADCRYDRADLRRMTLAEVVLVYLRSVPHCKRTVDRYRQMVEVHAGHLADRYVDSLGRRDLESVRESMRRAGNLPQTINDGVGKLKAAMRWAVDQDLISDAPWSKYRNLPRKPTEHRSGTLDEVRRVYACLPPWMRWAVRTAMALCLRPGVSELFRLTWDAFDWRSRSVEVAMPKVGASKIVYPPEGYLAEAWERREADMERGYDLVCRGRRDAAVGYSTYTTSWSAACRKAGVVGVSMYAIRHVAASEMLAAGVDLAAVAAQLGHKDLTTTGRYYAHALKSAQMRSAAAIPDLGRDGALEQGRAQASRTLTLA